VRECYRAAIQSSHQSPAKRLIEMMLTKKEPYNAERLLLSTGIVAYNMESNWENGRYSAVERRIETPFMNMTYHDTGANV
jgi:hypothetical protein